MRRLGGVAERSNAAVSKTVTGGSVGRGFKSLPLRFGAEEPARQAGFSAIRQASRQSGFEAAEGYAMSRDRLCDRAPIARVYAT